MNLLLSGNFWKNKKQNIERGKFLGVIKVQSLRIFFVLFFRKIPFLLALVIFMIYISQIVSSGN
jgi:hypothetical protein